MWIYSLGHFSIRRFYKWKVNHHCFFCQRLPNHIPHRPTPLSPPSDLLNVFDVKYAYIKYMRLIYLFDDIPFFVARWTGVLFAHTRNHTLMHAHTKFVYMLLMDIWLLSKKIGYFAYINIILSHCRNVCAYSRQFSRPPACIVVFQIVVLNVRLREGNEFR